MFKEENLLESSSFNASPYASLSYIHNPSLPTHQLNSTSNHTHNSASLNDLTASTSNSMLNVGQPVQPGDHNFWADFQLRQFLRQRRDDICQCETPGNLECIDCVETARHIQRVEQR